MILTLVGRLILWWQNNQDWGGAPGVSVEHLIELHKGEHHG